MIASRLLEILLVEDNPGDVRLTVEALHERHIHHRLNVARDGVEALAFLRHDPHYRDAARPDLILLDLNLPRKDGREVLAELKRDEDLATIPVMILSTSRTDADVLRNLGLHVDAYITKPVDLDAFIAVMQPVEELYRSLVALATP